MFKLILVLLACFIALAASQCGQYLDSYECQLASDSTSCCIWCATKSIKGQAANQPTGSCVSGVVANQNVLGTNGNPNQRVGQTYFCLAANTNCQAGIQGRCAPTANCPGVQPDISGTWYYPPECVQIGGQFNVTVNNGAVSVGSTSKQALRLPSFTGAIDSSGQLVLTNPTTGDQCYGYASARQMSLTCPSTSGWGSCQQNFYRSSAATVAASIVAVLGAVAMFALF